MSNYVNSAYRSATEQGIPVPKIVMRMVRSMVQDFAQTNELFDGEENSDEKIARYILDTVEDWNGTPPLLVNRIEPLDLVTDPRIQGARPIIQLGAAVRLLRSTIAKLGRNDMPYTAGNVNAQPNAVWRNLQAIVSEWSTEYENKKTQFKVGQNISDSYGGGGYRAAQTEYYDGYDGDNLYFIL